ncbi:hypothetical protein [Beduini massiliensis]|uniref:hypothetical protein n=1 Tax=Beduini massiliensis TaxID=1585974 RepID=UPI00059A8042|nr:hypothetical protein [Beduini massiliensis]
MKKLLRNLAVVALVLGVCSFDPIRGIPCDHQHDAECGYNEETGAGCTHTHDDGTIKPLDNGEGPLG